MSSTGQGNGLAGIVGANIKRARKDHKLFQRQLAAKIGVTPQHLSDWERGDYRPNDANLLKLGETLGKPYAWFFIDRAPELEQAA